MGDRLNVLDRSLRLLAELVASDERAIAGALADSAVLLRAPSALVAQTPSSQAGLATLTGQLVRSGLRVMLDVADVTTSTTLLRQGSLIDGLVAHGEEVIPGSVNRATDRVPDLEVIVGDDVPRADARVLFLGCDGDLAWFDAAPSSWSPSGPLAAMGAAGLAAGEAIRHAVRNLPPRAAWAVAALEPVERASFALPPFPRGPIDLGRLDVVSAGAITDALMWSLRARGGVAATGRIFDDGTYDLTNLNRYMELDRQTAEAAQSKARRVSSNAPDGIALEPVARRFGEDDLPGAAPIVIVGADDVAVRRVAQRAQPRWLGIAGTSHFEARITEHIPGGPCAGCAHPHLGDPPDGPIPTIAPVSFWAGYVLALRLLRAAFRGPADTGAAYSTYYPLTRPGVGQVGPVQWHPACPLDLAHRAAAS